MSDRFGGGSSSSSKQQPTASSHDESSSEDDNSPPTHNYWCYQCSRRLQNNQVENYTCSYCHTGFLEITDNPDNLLPAPPGADSSQDDSSQYAIEDFNTFWRMMNPLFQNLMEQPQQGGQGQAQQQQASSSQQGAPSQGQARSVYVPGSPPSANNPPIPGAGYSQQHIIPGQGGGLQGFLHNLFQGLTNGGNFQVQFHIENGEGGGNAFGFPFQLHGNAADYAWGPGGLDAIVTQLLNQVQGGTPPMAREKIDQLPEVIISKEQSEKHLQCAVCMDDFKIEEKVCQLACEHLFHRDCITPWLERHNSCPVCRKSAETGQYPDPHQHHATTYGAADDSNNSAPGPNNSSAPNNDGRSAPGLNRQQQPSSNNSSSSRPQWMDIEDLD